VRNLRLPVPYGGTCASDVLERGQSGGMPGDLDCFPGVRLLRHFRLGLANPYQDGRLPPQKGRGVSMNIDQQIDRIPWLVEQIRQYRRTFYEDLHIRAMFASEGYNIHIVAIAFAKADAAQEK
jgi:hypothetical protein